MVTPAVRGGIWNPSTGFSCCFDRSNGSALEDHLYFAFIGLVHAVTGVDPIFWSRSQLRLGKEAKHHSMAHASCLDLGPACCSTRRRRHVGQSALSDDSVLVAGDPWRYCMGMVA